jgi:ATP diphosphatase
MTKHYELEDLLYLMQRLRNPETGCPWDVKQTFESIIPHTIEEAHEVADAIIQQDWPHLEEELGDLLFQVIFYSQLGYENELFDFSSVINVLVTKLIRRHPHVFPNGDLQQERPPNTCPSNEEIQAQWQIIKATEKALKAQQKTSSIQTIETITSNANISSSLPKNKLPLIDYLDDIPLSLPALSQADKIQKTVSQRGFDWTEISGVIDKVREELTEVEEEIAERNDERLRHEVGDLLFAAVNLARHLDVDPEQALNQANRRFSERYTLVAENLSKMSKSLELGNSNNVSAEEMEHAWLQAKKRHEKL